MNDVNALVRQYYNDALQIAGTYKTSLLTPADKESIALEALLRAARLYDPTRLSKYTNKPVLFSTLVYQYVRGSLLVAKNRALRQRAIPQEKIISEESFKDEPMFGFKSYPGVLSLIPGMYDVEENISYQEILTLLKKRCTRYEWVILNLMLNPDRLRTKYRKYGFTRPPKVSKVTFTLIAKALGISRQRVHQHMLKIRRKTKRVYKSLENPDTKVR